MIVPHPKRFSKSNKQKMEKKSNNGAHILVVPYPTQGHINPMLHFSKRLASKGPTVTFATTRFILNSIHNSQPSDHHSVRFDTISDGHDQGRFAQSRGVADYLAILKAEGSKTLAELIAKYESTDNPIDCVVYDAFVPWALDVAKRFGLIGAAFFTQACVVNYIYYCLHHGVLKLPLSPPVAVPGLPELLGLQDFPSFVCVAGSYPSYFELVLNQFSNVEKADCVLVNTFHELEKEVVDSMSKLVCPLLTIGPTIPSMYLDGRVKNDYDYGLDLFTRDSSSDLCINWLNTKPKRSVIYVSFGSMASLSEKQMAEVANGLKNTNQFFLWVVRTSEEPKLPARFREEAADKGLVVSWSPQMEVLANEAIGCFFTHCGWNSTVEALSLGVPMVAMPQWTDQPTNAKFVEDVWKVGIRVRVDGESGIVGSEEIERCIREVMEGVRGREMEKNAKKWKELAKEALSPGGSSDKCIDQFVSKLLECN